MPATTPDEGTRQERKERTRQAILSAALTLSTHGGLSAVSLRQVAREVGIVPTAFYRHFDSVEELGLVLVDECFVSLRAMLRDVRRSGRLEDMITGSVQALVHHVRQHADHFDFIARERLAGPPTVRTAIRHELALCQRELADDVAAIAGTERWTQDRLDVLCELLVVTMVSTADKLLLTPTGPGADHVVAMARSQLRMVVTGAIATRETEPPA